MKTRQVLSNNFTNPVGHRKTVTTVRQKVSPSHGYTNGVLNESGASETLGTIKTQQSRKIISNNPNVPTKNVELKSGRGSAFSSQISKTRNVMNNKNAQNVSKYSSRDVSGKASPIMSPSSRDDQK